MPEVNRRAVDRITLEVVETEGLARDLAELAHDLAKNGHLATASILRDVSLKSRVRGMELRGRLSGMIAGHGSAISDGE